jgi:hypothetical protein
MCSFLGNRRESPALRLFLGDGRAEGASGRIATGGRVRNVPAALYKALGGFATTALT